MSSPATQVCLHQLLPVYAKGHGLVWDGLPAHAINPLDIESRQGGRQRDGIPLVGSLGQADDKDLAEAEGTVGHTVDVVGRGVAMILPAVGLLGAVRLGGRGVGGW